MRGRLSLVEEVELGCGAACASQVRENKVQATAGEPQEAVIFTGGSRGEDGRVAGGWSKDSFEAGPQSGGKYLGEGATVWDGEVARMAEVLEKGPRDRGVLILADPFRQSGRQEGRARLRRGSLSGL